MKKYHDLFNCPIYVTNLINEGIDNNSLKSFCDDYKEMDKGRLVSNRIGYQSNDLDLKTYVNNEDVRLQPIFDKIISHCNHYATDFGVNEDLEIALTGFWININFPNAVNMAHTHGFSFFSGVYYIDVPENSGNIVFTHPNQHIQAYWNVRYDGLQTFTQENSSNVERWWLPSCDGNLYIFPSWLEHSVEINSSKHNRYSFAFNTTLQKKTKK